MTSINPVDASATTATAGTRRHHNPLAKAADALGMSATDLKTELENGKSLDDVATEKGVSHDKLIAAIKAGMPGAGGPSAASAAAGASATSAVSGARAVSDVDPTALAEKIAGTKGLHRPHRHQDGAGGPKGMNSGVQDPGKLDELNKLLGGDASKVSGSTSATQLVSMLQSKGVDLNALRNVLNSGDLVDVSA